MSGALSDIEELVETHLLLFGLSSDVFKQIESPVSSVLEGLRTTPLRHELLELGEGDYTVIVGVKDLK